MEEVEKFTAVEVSEMLGLKKNSILYYFQKYEIGEKIDGTIYFTKEDINYIRKTDRRKK